jgi:hypothetical protein
VDTDASRLAADNFDLSRVEADADADPEFRDCRIHQCPGADRLCGTVEQREKAVACRCHLSAAQAVDRRSDSLVVLAEDVCPGMVTESLEDLGGAHDVTEEHGRENAIPELLGRQPEGVGARKLNRLPWLVAEHVDVVSGRNS